MCAPINGPGFHVLPVLAHTFKLLIYLMCELSGVTQDQRGNGQGVLLHSLSPERTNTTTLFPILDLAWQSNSFPIMAFGKHCCCTSDGCSKVAFAMALLISGNKSRSIKAENEFLLFNLRLMNFREVYFPLLFSSCSDNES